MFIMTDDDLQVAIERMRLAGTDLAGYEMKSAAGGFPKSTADSISAFANTSGGAIVFGIVEGKGFHAVRDLDVKMIQSGCAHAARELVEPPQAVDIRVLEFEGCPVVVVNVQGAPVREKPVYVKKLGLANGSYVRTGDGDHKMSRYEIDRFIENQQRVARNDIAIVPDATLADLDESLLAGWLANARTTTLDRSIGAGDEDLMANRRVVAADDEGVLRPTLAGLLALGRYPQMFYPRLNIVFTSYPSSRKGEPGASGARFVDTVNIEGPIPEMVVNAVRAVSRNMKHGAVVRGSVREDVPDYPLAAIREAVANALIHRDYSPDSQGTPVTIDLYPDRLEVSNPGGLFGAMTIDKLGSSGATASRNQFLARILEDVPYTDFDGRTGRVVENRGSGYPTIDRELKAASLESPIVDSTLDGFVFEIRNTKLAEGGPQGRVGMVAEAAIREYLSKRDSASAAEIALVLGVSPKTARMRLNALIDEGVVEAIGAKTSPKRAYRLPR